MKYFFLPPPDNFTPLVERQVRFPKFRLFVRRVLVINMNIVALASIVFLVSFLFFLGFNLASSITF